MGVKEQIAGHLEFLGYEVSEDGGVTRALHSRRWNLLMKEYKGGVLFTSFLGGNDFAKRGRNRQAYLEFINTMNHRASVARFYIDDDSDLVMEAFWAGDYDKVNFGEFMELWDADTRANLDQAQAQKFFA